MSLYAANNICKGVKKFVEAVADAGAECYRVCDTVRIGLPELDAPLSVGIPAKIKALKAETRIKAIEIHVHDDLGNAVGNTIAAVRTASGVWDKIYINTTCLGIGERAGNAETEKIILNLFLHYGVLGSSKAKPRSLNKLRISSAKQQVLWFLPTKLL